MSPKVLSNVKCSKGVEKSYIMMTASDFLDRTLAPKTDLALPILARHAHARAPTFPFHEQGIHFVHRAWIAWSETLEQIVVTRSRCRKRK